MSDIDAVEEWRPTPGSEDRYEVSNRGRVRSLDHLSSNGHETYLRKGRILSPGLDAYGYRVATVGRKSRKVHQLVLLAFVGPPAEGHEVRHLNGDKTDNHLENLCYGTVSDNAYDRVRHGTHHETRKTHCRRKHEYTPENVITARRPNGSIYRKCRTCWNEYQRNRARQRYVPAALRVTTKGSRP